MQKSMLWEAFATLDRGDLRELAKFVRSPFFNGKSQVIGLFDYLRSCQETGLPPEFEPAWRAAYPEIAQADMVKIRLVQSDLLALIEHFWMYQEKFADLDRGKIRLAAVYRRKGLTRHFQVTMKEAKQSRTKQPWRHAEHFHDLNLLEWEQFQFAAAQKRYDTFNLQEINDLLDVTYIARKLRHVCLSLSHQVVTGQAYKFGLIESILAHIESEGLAKRPLIGLYYHIYHFLSPEAGEGSAHFFQFRVMLADAAPQFPPEELRTFYLLALNFCIKKSNVSTEKNVWFRQTLELYREALALQLLLDNGVLSRFAFNNIVGVAVWLEEVDWAQDFIEQWVPRLERKFRAAARSLSLARVAYARRDYANALGHLQLADYRDLISGMNARILLLKIYYETNEYDLLDSHLDSVKTYLQRQRATGYHLENYVELIRMTRQLIRCKLYDAQALAALRSTVETHPSLLEKEWFLDQMR